MSQVNQSLHSQNTVVAVVVVAAAVVVAVAEGQHQLDASAGMFELVLPAADQEAKSVTVNFRRILINYELIAWCNTGPTYMAL
jgi:F0F1-type ATP synthase assembly protein I